MVEYAVKTSIELINLIRRKNVGFRHGHISSVIGNVLRAGESTLLGKTRRTTGNKRCRLVVAKTSEGRVFAGKVVIQANVKLSLIQAPHGSVGVVEPQSRFARIADRIKIDHCLTGRIKHVVCDLVARCAYRLNAACTGRKWIARSIA